MKNLIRIWLFTVLFPLLTGCGGGGSGSSSVAPPSAQDSGDSPAPELISVGGSAVKGPLANAEVRVFALDFTQPDFRGSELASASTNDAAQIVGLELAGDQTYLLEISSIPGQTTDLSTGLEPVITRLRTILREEIFAGNAEIYPTPVTTMITDLAILNADQLAPYQGNQDGTVTLQEFMDALDSAEDQFKSAIGYGLKQTIDVDQTNPLITASTDTNQELEDTLAYRTVVEALTTVVYNVAQASGTDSDTVLSELARDLSDGTIDAFADGAASGVYDNSILATISANPANLIIPNTSVRVADTLTLLTEETAETGQSQDTSELTGDSFTLEIAGMADDIDDDGVLNLTDAFPYDATESVDSDGDRIGDNLDDDDDNDGVDDVNDPFPYDRTENSDIDHDGIGDNADSDRDGDGVDDEADDFPTDAERAQYIDADSDGWPEGEDPDDTDASVPADSFEDSDNDGISNIDDTDDDNDGVSDDEDMFPLDAREHNDLDGDGIGDNSDADIDSDGVANENDAFPHDDQEDTDTDHDGEGNNSDHDDDGDGVDDQADAFPEDSSESSDSDSDGTGDGEDHDDDNNGIDDSEENNDSDDDDDDD